jgi:hypothetical protein
MAMVILGISIGTRTSGIAILNNGQLRAWNTLSFKDTWSERKGQYIVDKYERYLKKHNVTVVVLKIPRLSHHTDAILTLLKKLESIIGFHGCMVEYKTQADIKTALPDIKNWKDLVHHTTELYPVLIKEKTRELSNRNNYHDKMFEAVLVAHLCKEEKGYPIK